MAWERSAGRRHGPDGQSQGAIPAPTSRSPARVTFRAFPVHGGALPNSMTGFGAAEGPVGGGRLRVEIRTVNHRYFNLAPKLPADLSSLEGEMRERLRREFDRGHV